MSFCGSPTCASAPAKPKPCSSPNVNATSHGARSVRPRSPRRERTISAATKTMLSAMIASTGAEGTCTKPSVASASVMLCAMVNAVIVFTSKPDAAHDEHEREDEEQVIDPEEDVLHAEHEVTARRRSRGFLRENERRRVRPQQPRDDAPIGERDAHEHIRHRRLQAMHRDLPAIESARRPSRSSSV